MFGQICSMVKKWSKKYNCIKIGLVLKDWSALFVITGGNYNDRNQRRNP